MSHRERLKRVFKCEEVDRMPVRIWGISPIFQNEKFKPLCEFVRIYDLESIEFWSPLKEEIPPLPYEIEDEGKIIENEGMKEVITKISLRKMKEELKMVLLIH